ncbi:hypothetical protein conserved [Leishmania donovani]|uniref:Hypothetical_protein_conserved n=1 Tax=Leishmania donovani TaxID=5661 RepID=A0A6J8FBR8_LEIDO|nr:hypothetical protein conserved [Leishmania donovani]VDZ44932.1 hypothetical_protein_conserved [Leishmania donovani]
MTERVVVRLFRPTHARAAQCRVQRAGMFLRVHCCAFLVVCLSAPPPALLLRSYLRALSSLSIRAASLHRFFSWAYAPTVYACSLPLRPHLVIRVRVRISVRLTLPSALPHFTSRRALGLSPIRGGAAFIAHALPPACASLLSTPSTSLT